MANDFHDAPRRHRPASNDGQRAEIRSGLPDKIKVIAKASSVIREGDTVIVVPLRDK